MAKREAGNLVVNGMQMTVAGINWEIRNMVVELEWLCGHTGGSCSCRLGAIRLVFWYLPPSTIALSKAEVLALCAVTVALISSRQIRRLPAATRPGCPPQQTKSCGNLRTRSTSVSL